MRDSVPHEFPRADSIRMVLSAVWFCSLCEPASNPILSRSADSRHRIIYTDPMQKVLPLSRRKRHRDTVLDAVSLFRRPSVERLAFEVVRRDSREAIQPRG